MQIYRKSSPLKKEALYKAALDRIAELESMLEDPADYSSMTVAELRSHAQDRDIKNYSSMKKAELVEALNG